MESPDCFALCGDSMPVCCCLCSLILSPVCLDWWLNEYLISVYEGGDMGGRIFELILKRRHAWKSRPIWNSLPYLRLAKKLSYSISAMSHNTWHPLTPNWFKCRSVVWIRNTADIYITTLVWQTSGKSRSSNESIQVNKGNKDYLENLKTWQTGIFELAMGIN